jgi:endonuclease YncB( thermonuclease family)
LAVLLSGLPAVAAPTVMIERCHDGDSCRTTSGEAIRLACIDAPELTGSPNAQRLAQASRDYLRELVVGKEVLIRRIGKDRYGRAIAEIYLWPLNIGEEMVASGHARILDRYASQCPWALL